MVAHLSRLRRRLVRYIAREILHPVVGKKITAALCAVAATAPLRSIDHTNPVTWEFAGFSQNGEDGVIDYLTRKAMHSTQYFLEIGSSDGLENNTSWLVFGRRFSGVMVEGDSGKSRLSEYAGPGLRPGVTCLNQFVDIDNVDSVLSHIAVDHLDVLSIDIDGIDLYVASKLLENGLRPAVLVVEYNATFGPERTVSVPYQPRFDYRRAHPSQLYFGASIGAWRCLARRHDLTFLTVEQNGVNAFFVDPRRFPSSFLSEVRGTTFRDNFYQRHAFRCGWEQRFELISHMDLESIDERGKFEISTSLRG